jgi:subtilisin
MVKRLAFVMLIVSLSLPTALSAGAGAAEDVGYIVVLRPSAGSVRDVVEAHTAEYGITVGFVYENVFKGYSALVPEDRVDALRSDPDVRFLSLDRRISALAQTVPTGVDRIDAEGPAGQSSGLQIAVIDTGIDVDHPDLAGRVMGGTGCSGGSSFDDRNGHGTHVAGTIAANDNAIGVVGIAPDAKLWAVRVLNRFGFGSTGSIVCGIDFVDSKSPAKGGRIVVANMSLGGAGADDGNCGMTNNDAMHKAICRAVADGVTFVVAAGNESEDVRFSTPAAYDEVVTVSALADSDGAACGIGGATSQGADDTFAGFSNFATLPSDLAHLVAAPGVDIVSTVPGGYDSFSGTSMASPHTAGLAGLFIREYFVANGVPPTPADVLAHLQDGEFLGVNYNGECSVGNSHTDPSGRHPEPVIRAV